MTKSRFDLENDILRMGHVSDDINTLITLVLDGPEPLDEDTLANYLMGIEYTLRLREQALWDTYKRIFLLDEYKPRHAYEDYPDDQDDLFEWAVKEHGE